MNKSEPVKKTLGNRFGWAYKQFFTPEVGILIPILILCIITNIINPKFLSVSYLSSILYGSAFIGMAALAESLVIMSGEIDLSVGMNGCFAGIMCGMAAYHWGMGTVPCLLIALLAGATIGALNGFCVCILKLSSWITTLATQFICEGLAVTISQGEALTISSLGLSSITRARPLGLTWIFFVFVGLIIVVDIMVRKTKFGFRLRAVGANKESAQMAGINVTRTKMIVFILAGMLVAVGGLFDVLNSGAASSSFGAGREFRAIICCAIGGISMSGGEGSIYGVGLGVLLFHVLWYCLRILNVDTNLQLVLIGLILVLAVIMDTKRKQIEAKRML